MKHLHDRILSLMVLCFIMLLLHPSSSFAEELYRQFSLTGGRLTTAPADVKAPEPGIVTAKYGFKIMKDFVPYMGTGLAYTYQPDAKTGDVTRLKTGVAAQLGFSYLLGENSTLKLDYKYLNVSPEQSHGDPRTPPQSLGIGLDIKF
jgi:opacity protein-like surface antigen